MIVLQLLTGSERLKALSTAHRPSCVQPFKNYTFADVSVDHGSVVGRPVATANEQQINSLLLSVSGWC
jgi:hypothetical protein